MSFLLFLLNNDVSREFPVADPCPCAGTDTSFVYVLRPLRIHRDK
jgi:hypothetical protein